MVFVVYWFFFWLGFFFFWWCFNGVVLVIVFKKEKERERSCYIVREREMIVRVISEMEILKCIYRDYLVKIFIFLVF